MGHDHTFYVFDDIPADAKIYLLRDIAQKLSRQSTGIGDRDWLCAAHGRDQFFLQNVRIGIVNMFIHDPSIHPSFRCVQKALSIPLVHFGQVVLVDPRIENWYDDQQHGLAYDFLITKGYVKKKYVKDGKHCVDLAWWISRLFGKVYEEGIATVEHPSGEEP